MDAVPSTRPTSATAMGRGSARMDELGEADRIGERGTGAPSFPLAIAIANFSFPHTRCEEGEKGRRNVLTFYPCQPHSIVVRTSTPPPVNLPRPSTAALQHENREWGIGGIGGERRASISKKRRHICLLNR